MTAVLLCRTGDDAGLARLVSGPECVIGRGEACSLSLLHPQLSREHARVSVAAGGDHRLEDLGSRNGTALNGRPLPPGEPGLLAHLDRITLGGDLELVFLVLERVPSTEVVAAHVLDPGGARVPLQLGINRIGSGEEADLIVTDREVTPLHAELELSVSGLVARRMVGAGPLRVNGVEVDRALLRDGDCLGLAPASEFEVEIVTGRGESPAAVADEEGAPAASPPAAERSEGERTATLESDELRDALDRARERRQAELAAARELEGRVAPDAAVAGSSGDTDGSSTLRRSWVRSFTPEEAAALPAQQAVRREAAARLLFRLPGGVEEEAVLLREGRHLVGRHAGCRVRFAEPSVSREHAEILVTPQGITVVDLGSANGTWRGGERIELATFDDGDEVRFGVVEARFESI